MDQYTFPTIISTYVVRTKNNSTIEITSHSSYNSTFSSLSFSWAILESTGGIVIHDGEWLIFPFISRLGSVQRKSLFELVVCFPFIHSQ